VTGAASLDVTDVSRKLEQFKCHTSLPIAVGFGIRDATSAAAVARLADGVVVGSAIVQRIGQNAADPTAMTSAVGDLVADIRQAVDAK
jgi:tryptophan synthase alpha chain